MRAKRIYRELEFIDSGAECEVFDYSKNKVLKLYKTIGERERAFARQKESRRFGFAPPTYGRCNSPRRPVFRYGYLSAKADVSKRIKRKELYALRRCMKFIGLFTGDIDVDWNVGYYYGNPVVIDFGDMSSSPSKTSYSW